MKMYVLKNNQQLGPFEEAEVEAGLINKTYSPTDTGCREGMKVWQPLEKLFPQYELKRRVSYAIKIISISTVAVTLGLIFVAWGYDGTGEAAFQLAQMIIIVVLHFLCLVYLFNAGHNVNRAIIGMLPGSVWNLLITFYGLVNLGNPHARSVSLGAAILLDYWWLSNLIRFLKVRKLLAAQKERKALATATPNTLQ